jgi:hypothetical protein
MKGYSEISIQNRGIYVAYKGEHYVVRHRSGRVTRMAKADINWDAPDVIYSESVEGTEMSAEASVIINALHADEYDENEEQEG